MASNNLASKKLSATIIMRSIITVSCRFRYWFLITLCYYAPVFILSC